MEAVIICQPSRRPPAQTTHVLKRRSDVSSLTCRHSTASCQLGFQPTTLKKSTTHRPLGRVQLRIQPFGPRVQNMACVPSNSLVTSAVGLRANACVRPRSTTRDCPARGGDARNKQTKTSKLTHCAMYRCATDGTRHSECQFGAIPGSFLHQLRTTPRVAWIPQAVCDIMGIQPEVLTRPTMQGKMRLHSNEITRLWDPILFWIESA